VRDYECQCGKYKRMKHRGVVCEECGVEVIQSKVRRERFGHITLAEPMVHPWLVEQAPSTLLRTLPVLPPDLRPLVPLDGGRFATSDLNDLYRRVINRNNRLMRLLELNAPEIIIDNETSELFSAVHALFSNGTTGGPKVTGPDDRALVSLLGMVASRRDGLISKRVDYSACAMLVVDPGLEPSECRVPERITRELFRPMAYGRMESEGRVTTIKEAKAALERGEDWALAAIDAESRGYPVLLMSGTRMASRKIRLWDQVAIAVDPTTAALLDGTPVTLHLPLTREAREECERLDPPAEAPAPDASGWFARFMAGADPKSCLIEAASNEAIDPLEDPVLRLALGLPPS
jgi:DNA-directed RNA polymerase beta' subunit